MASQSDTSAGGELSWPSNVKTEMFVLDFDKTITNKHTRGAIFQTAQLEPEELQSNFADLEFFKKVSGSGIRICVES